jgi:hypothetical protein
MVLLTIILALFSKEYFYKRVRIEIILLIGLTSNIQLTYKILRRFNQNIPM